VSPIVLPLPIDQVLLVSQNNVLIGTDMQVQLADFGLLLLDDTTDYTKTDEQAFTPNWSSPERWNGERRSRVDDVYSCGCLGYMVSACCVPTAPVDLNP
jgi:serine/threonine protein kinase